MSKHNRKPGKVDWEKIRNTTDEEIEAQAKADLDNPELPPGVVIDGTFVKFRPMHEMSGILKRRDSDIERDEDRF